MGNNIDKDPDHDLTEICLESESHLLKLEPLKLEFLDMHEYYMLAGNLGKAGMENFAAFYGIKKDGPSGSVFRSFSVLRPV
jgi:hypothetical protein